MVDITDEGLNEYSFVNSVCDSMDPADILLSLVLECPHDAKRKSCPIKEVANWRKMEIKDARDAIDSLPHNTKKELVEKHRCCSCSLANKCVKIDK